MTESPRIRVMTLNVTGRRNSDWERRCPVIARTIAELDPDVIAVQDVQVDTPEVIDAFLATLTT